MTKLFNDFIASSDYHSILCLDGALPDATLFPAGLPIIAADGAANTLIKMGITPQIVIGDLDGIDPALLPQLNTYYHFDQNFCDFEKSLSYLEKNSLLPCIIFGITGGCLDHILNNVNIFMKSNNFLYAPPIYGQVINQPASQIINLTINTKLSLFGIPSATVSTQGLKWELHHSLLSFPGKNSCFNRNIKNDITITVDQGSVLLLIYESESLCY